MNADVEGIGTTPGTGSTSTDPADTDSPPKRRVTVAGVAIVLVVLVGVVFWTWALFFASKEAVNKIGDREWAARAEQVCAPVKAELAVLDRQSSTDLDERAALVDQSTDLLSGMLDDLEAVEPTDDKGRAIVPEWIDDYRSLLAARYAYADQLRAGEDGPFLEPAKQGIPITEPIETFAGDNEMPSCAPPRAGVL